MHSLFNSISIQNRLERGPRLTTGGRGPIETAGAVIGAAGHGQNAAGCHIHGNERALGRGGQCRVLLPSFFKGRDAFGHCRIRRRLKFCGQSGVNGQPPGVKLLRTDCIFQGVFYIIHKIRGR